jgi:outer membrane protein assembly factor BamB
MERWFSYPALDHALYALRLSDGSLVWKKDLESSLVSAPVWDQNGYLFINTLNGDVLSLKTIDGSVNWQFSTQGTLWSSPLLHENTLFVGSSEGKTKGKVFAYPPVDGSKIWERMQEPGYWGRGFVSDSVVFPLKVGTFLLVDCRWNLKWAQSLVVNSIARR